MSDERRIREEAGRPELERILRDIVKKKRRVALPDHLRKMTKYETANWLNLALEKLWPSLVPQLDKILCASLNPILEANLPPAFTALYFESIRFGLRPPQIIDLRVPKNPGDAVLLSTGRTRPKGSIKESRVCIDVRVRFSVKHSDSASVRLTAKTLLLAIPVTVDNISFEAALRFEMRNLGGDNFPCFEAIAFSFLKEPNIDFNLIPGTGFDVAHMPLLRDVMSNVLKEHVSEELVSPNSKRMKLSELLPDMFEDED